MNVRLLDASHPHWSSELERLGVLLRQGNNPALFPYHFLYVTLSKIGGKLALFADGSRTLGAGFLFPRQITGNGSTHRRTYTLRFHAAPGVAPNADEIAAALQRAQPDATVIFYDPAGVHAYSRTGERMGWVEIGRPDADEAGTIRSLQRTIWGSPDEFLYPADIHSDEFGAGTSLVARVDGRVAGFLFGFYRFGGSMLPEAWAERFNGALRLESQTMGVLPEYRGLRIANLLKKQQAELAWREGIGLIHWTADPLQYANAALNFGLLKAIAYDFAPDLYPFRNELNRVRASRFSLTWLVGSKRVRAVPALGAHAEIVDLARRRTIPRVNRGCETARFDVAEEILAIEVPVDWTALQQNDVGAAQAWRALTDEIFAAYIGLDSGRYVVTGVAADGEQRFLLAERAGAELWTRVSTPD